MPKRPAVPTFLHPSRKKVGYFGLLAGGLLPVRRLSLAAHLLLKPQARLAAAQLLLKPQTGLAAQLLLLYLTSLAVGLLLLVRRPGLAAHLLLKPQTTSIASLLLLGCRTGSAAGQVVGSWAAPNPKHPRTAKVTPEHQESVVEEMKVEPPGPR